MPARGKQFPTVNVMHFDDVSDPDALVHNSQHGEYRVEHVFHPTGDGGGYGVIRMHHPDKRGANPWDVDRFGQRSGGAVASLKYDLEQAPRHTSLRPQPFTHTEYIDVAHEHRGKGLTHVMRGVLAAAHPGAPNVASNELTPDGARWRQHLARAGKDSGERVGYHVPYDEKTKTWDEDNAGLRVFRPAPGKPKHALLDAGFFEEPHLAAQPRKRVPRG